MLELFHSIDWDLYCPFQGVRAYAEVVLTSKGRGQRGLRSTVQAGSYRKSNGSDAVTMKTLDISTKDYLIFRTTHANTEDQAKVVISYPHLRRFMEALAQAEATFSEPGKCYAESDSGEFVLTDFGKSEAATVFADSMFGNASIAFQPVIFKPDDSEDSDIRATGDAGVRLLVNDYEKYGDCSIEDFLSFAYFYERFNLLDFSQRAVSAAASSGLLKPSGRSASSAPPVAQPARKKT